MKQKQKAQEPANVGQKRFGGGWGHRRTSKQYLAGLWSNSDSELSQEINAQNGTCYCGLQKLSCEKLAQIGWFFKQNPKRGLVGHLLP
jgi:hypothetical protein